MAAVNGFVIEAMRNTVRTVGDEPSSSCPLCPDSSTWPSSITPHVSVGMWWVVAQWSASAWSSGWTVEGSIGITLARPRYRRASMATIEQARAIALALPRTTEALVRDRVKFRIGQIVYLAFSRDETMMGFAFPKEERDALVASEPEKFLLPKPSDMRYRWVVVRLDRIDEDELRELIEDAWRMCVPKRVAAEHLGS